MCYHSEPRFKPFASVPFFASENACQGYLQAISYPECLGRRCANGVATWEVSAFPLSLGPLFLSHACQETCKPPPTLSVSGGAAPMA